mmetsp:Transcript_81418/g.143756  ORF Transcript_81418/g.143756 Transcript_81418/m.143756 type:complete len:98 (-) Transcript_81418:103-396(-)|eukprot:CAMPEP_0197643674 /NCGR_PEP_ID=MMETSP1338-20131121/16905_1 /TAXON_ID=43686 ORGANISM="Pelagodinium beii, Strain RCC1491" /NCGR_SAMPLE_ID=MMETSP1338 /ASSEMBLY_ACC=CAM_ASM_000754 /LENGTH=97 /DNA_ID=CAMNT_0043216949 /DNA_START=38 /DNA_END=331 /DNA_ORIENTATION=-
MPGTVAIKLLEPLPAGKEAAGYWLRSASIHAKDVFAVEATSSTDVAQLKASVAAKTGLAAESLQVVLFGKDLQNGRTLGSYGLGNIEDPLLHVIPVA